jgi:hypothetical protein
MIKVKFNDEAGMHQVEFKQISAHVVQLVGNIKKNTSGFKTYRLNGAELGDFSDFKTIHQPVDGGFQFSDDGSVKPTPEEPISFDEMYAELLEVQAENTKLASNLAATEQQLQETKEQLAETQAELTDTQLALCEVYEIIGG